MSDLVELTINGRPVAVKPGTNLIEAARQVGVEIPHFCYHPGLKVVAVCRQCMVEIKGQPKLVAGCQVEAKAGMEVLTQSALAKDAQRQQLEFLLINHPVDCPICDQVGECDLQRLYFDYDCQPTRHDLARVPMRKAVAIGPRVTYDEERCILCWRCIRVCDEVARAHELDLKDRGFQTVVATAPGKALENPYSLCTADVCPVGALTETAFRFDTRVYRLRAVDSVCPGCATGCRIELHTYAGAVRRTRPRFDPDVNRYWMCDDGRYLFRALAAPDRLTRARVAGEPRKRADALHEAARLIGAAKADEVLLLVSAEESTETLFAASRLAAALPGAQVIATHRPGWAGDDILRSPDRDPNGAGLTRVFGDAAGGPEDLEQRLSSGTARLAICVGGETVDPALAESVGRVVVLGRSADGIAARAAVALPIAGWAEQDGTFVNRQGRVGRFHAAVEAPGDARPAWEVIAALGEALQRPLGLGAGAAEIYAQASQAAGAEHLPPEAFGPPRPGVLLRFAHGRG